ncbi:MAG TPA: hypothetical protein VK640_04100 [Actinomycetes bacterium]|nr:hypothetical protein [Actinomycetes bacterium]
MSGRAPSAPDLLPILSRGKHRSSRKGACFMEMASVLAGERWSDHPRCTHPLLGELARLVNDCTSDAGRQELAVLIPSVVGLTSDDVRSDARIALRAATTALPVASADRQKALAVAVITADSVLAVLDGRPPGDLLPQSRAALDAAPEARRWGYGFVRQTGITPKGFRRHAAPHTVRIAVLDIAESGVPGSDALLRSLLAGAIADCEAVVRHESAGRPAPTAMSRA